MNEQKNIFDVWEFPEGLEPRFTNAHIVSHTPREFFITFGVASPPRKKMTAVAGLILTREHVMELVLNLQSQLKKLQEENK